MKKYIFIIIIILLSFKIFAQVPNAMKYQAVVRGANGSPIINRALFVRFSIHEALPNGVIVYQELHATQTNEFGMLNLNLGTGNTGYNFASINWGNGQSKWISVDIDTTGGSNFFNLGTTQLLSVPYAFYAASAGNSVSTQSFWEEYGAGIFYNDGSVGIGTNNPESSAKLEISSTSQGFLPPRMTTAQLDLISNPAVSVMIFNLNTNCLNIYKQGGWFELCGNCIPPPQPIAQSNSPACQGDTIKLFAINSGGANCTWTGPNGFTSNQENPIITPAGTQHQGTYTLITSNACGSTNPVSVLVNVLPLPESAGTISGTHQFCANSGPFVFNIAPVSNASSYNWTLPTGFSIVSGAGSNQISVMVGPNAVSGNINVTPINSCGSGQTSPNFAVNVFALPDDANAGADQLNVLGTSVVLQANNPINGTGQWSIASGVGGSFVNPNIYNTQFNGQIGSLYELVWTITNSCGSSADTVLISFLTSFACGDLFLDVRDGKTYATVQIGSQCWMAENLNYGTMIQGSVHASDNGIPEKYCYLNNEDSCSVYGGLYTWREMLDLPDHCESQSCANLIGPNHQGLCPNGWHVASDADFIVLEMELGMSESDANMMNVWRGAPVGTMLWDGGSSGFNVKGAGRFTGGNGFGLVVNYEYSHTSDELAPNMGVRRCYEKNVPTVGRWNTFPKAWSLSVRCVKNN